MSQELEKEGISSKLSGLLNTFRTEELSLETINEEVEIVRQQIYERIPIEEVEQMLMQKTNASRGVL